MVIFSLLSTSSAYAEELSVEEKVQAAYKAYAADEQVTLDKGKWRAGLTFGMNHTAIDFAGLASVEQTAWQVDTHLSYGITERMELSLLIPFGLYVQETSELESARTRTSTSDLGQVQVGVAYALPTKTVGVTTYGTIAFDTGSGQLAEQGMKTSLGVNVDKIMRPAFVYGGIGWQRTWDTDFDSIEWKAGLGFALNESLSMGSEVVGIYHIDDVTVGSRQSHQLHFRTTWLPSENLSISPTVSIGVSGDAPDFGAQISVDRRF